MCDITCPVSCGKCCLIYLEDFKGGGRNTHIDFGKWINAWMIRFRRSGAFVCGVQPHFHPLDVHTSSEESITRYRKLKTGGIDPEACQFLGSNGCRLPREYRPEECRKYVCETIAGTASDARKRGVEYSSTQGPFSEQLEGAYPPCTGG